MLSFRTFSALLTLLFLSLSAHAQPAAQTDPAKAGPDFAVQGEYVGLVETAKGVETSGGKAKFGAQVIALGKGEFHLVAYHGGLPGAGWDKSDKFEADGKAVDGVVQFASPAHEAKVTLKDGALTVTDTDGKVIGTLKKTFRKSPTLGAKPPVGAVVLFDGATAEHFQKGRKTPDGLLQQGAVSKQKFGSATIHVEFRTPFTPDGRDQKRGNSGCYVQGCYEVQILDSFGLEGKDNECGGIYKVARPAVNMCLPPLSWQTYDIDFTAATFRDGKKTANARITVRHNGVVIHDNVEIPSATPGGTQAESPEGGPLFLQDHHDPVRFRNVWIVPKEG
ncbi:MAG: DUF1080 domain-containing protein [Pirellulales bacterium]|nr:DUF1080 domain-containing protein [Pirellulales bacterium]